MEDTLSSKCDSDMLNFPLYQIRKKCGEDKTVCGIENSYKYRKEALGSGKS